MENKMQKNKIKKSPSWEELTFAKPHPVYFFENICRNDGEVKLDDKAYKVFFIASEYAKMEGSEERSFFKFLSGLGAESELTKSIEEKVSFAKKNMRWRKQYMTWQQTIDEEKDIAYEEGREEGIEEGRVDAAENLLRMGAITDEQISQATGLPLNRVLQIKQRIMNLTPSDFL